LRPRVEQEGISGSHYQMIVDGEHRVNGSIAELDRAHDPMDAFA
jgi:hypothetical protein